MKTYRDEIRRLETLATSAPWATDGELYGVHRNGAFMPLGFAPHRPLDSRLIVVYRTAVTQLIEAVDAVEQFALRASANGSVAAAVGISQVLAILDDRERQKTPFRGTLVELDRKTTPPLWDPGHLVLGMELDAQHRSLGIAIPEPGDPPLIAVARIAVPRALRLLAFAEETIVQHGLLDGCLRDEGAVAIVAAVAAFDRHSASEGSGTGTV